MYQYDLGKPDISWLDLKFANIMSLSMPSSSWKSIVHRFPVDVGVDKYIIRVKLRYKVL